MKKLNHNKMDRWFHNIQTTDDENLIKTITEKVAEHLFYMTLPVGGHYFYRARTLNEEDIVPTHLDDLLQPPPSLTYRGRCNLDGDPVLYVTDNPYAIIQECNIHVGQRFIVTQFDHKKIVEEDVIVFPLGLEAQTALRPDNTLTEALAWKYKNMGSQANKLKKLEHKIHTQFVKDDSDKNSHIFSSIISNHFLKSDTTDAIYYPSIATNGIAKNFAVKPGKIFKAYTADKAILFKFEGEKWTQLDSATILNDGSLEWGRCHELDNPVPVNIRRVEPNDPYYVAPWL